MTSSQCRLAPQTHHRQRQGVSPGIPFDVDVVHKALVASLVGKHGRASVASMLIQIPQKTATFLAYKTVDNAVGIGEGLFLGKEWSKPFIVRFIRI